MRKEIFDFSKSNEKNEEKRRRSILLVQNIYIVATKIELDL